MIASESLPQDFNVATWFVDRNVAEGRGARPAFHYEGRVLTYADVQDLANRTGNALRELGVGMEDRVWMCCLDAPEFLGTFWGAIKLGAIPVPSNTLLRAADYVYFLRDSRAQVAVVSAALLPEVGPALGQSPWLRHVLVAGGPAGQYQGWEDLVGKASARLEAAPTSRDDAAFWMYSSGSTGRPKGIVHLQHDMAYSEQAFARNVLKLTSDDICFSVPKIFFAYGFGNAITFPFSVGAATLLLPGQPKPATIFEAIGKYRPSIFYGLPTLYTSLTKAEGAAATDFSSLRMALSAAEVLSAEVFNGWKALTGLEIIEGLGSTEALHIYLSNRPEKKKLGAAGLRVPGYEIVLKDKDGREVGDNEEGILWVRGDSNTPLYWNRPDKSAETIREGGWIYTGDRFLRDADGFHFFRGRADDLIKISGQWVYPLEVELCLAEHPDIRECAVFAAELPDRRMTLKAVVVMNKGEFDTRDATKTLQDYVKAKLLPYKYPREIRFIAELPKTGTGKIDRQALMKM